jgi:rubrerythrin
MNYSYRIDSTRNQRWSNHCRRCGHCWDTDAKPDDCPACRDNDPGYTYAKAYGATDD